MYPQDNNSNPQDFFTGNGQNNTTPPQAPQTFNSFSDPQPAPVAEVRPVQQSYSTPLNQDTPQGYSSYSGLQRGGILKATAYLPEYLTMLVVLSALLAAVTSLLDIGIGYLSAPNSTSTGDDAFGFSSGIEVFQLTWSTATAMIAAPLFIFLYLRTRATEKSEPAVKLHRWRRGFLGAFLAIEILTIFCMLVGLVFNLVARVIDKDGALYLLSDGAKTPVWHPIVATLFGVALIGFVVWSLANQYKNRTS